jgi:thioesterase domain-containing protein/acyl carrier protein
MVPATVEVVEALPTMPNGKVDRSRLPEPSSRPAPAATAPAEPLEGDLRTMVELWEEVLEADRVGPDDDFFDLGGHSLVAVRLFARIAKRLDANLPLAVLFEATTPRSLVAHIHGLRAGTSTERTYVHLVPITDGEGRRPPVFCIHGLGGNVLNQRAMAKGLGPDWTYVGIQAAGVDGLTPFHTTLDEICDAYIDEITAFHPDGPFFLGGYSNGGLIALELAERMERLGRTVLAVVFLDTIHPGASVPRIPLQTHLKELRKRGPSYVIDRVLDRRKRAKRAKEVAGFAEYVPQPGVPAPWEVREQQLYEHNLALLSGYEPRTRSGRVIIMSAADDWKYQHLAGDRGWADTIPHIEVVLTPGDHMTLMDGANAPVIAERLHAALEGVVADSEAGDHTRT